MKVKIRSFELKVLGLYGIVKNGIFNKKVLRQLKWNDQDINKFLSILEQMGLIEKVYDISGKPIGYKFTEKIKEYEENVKKELIGVV